MESNLMLIHFLQLLVIFAKVAGNPVYSIGIIIVFVLADSISQIHWLPLNSYANSFFVLQ